MHFGEAEPRLHSSYQAEPRSLVTRLHSATKLAIRAARRLNKVRSCDRLRLKMAPTMHWQFMIQLDLNLSPRHLLWCLHDPFSFSNDHSSESCSIENSVAVDLVNRVTN